MAGEKSNASPREGDSDADPYAGIRRKLNYYRLFAVLGVLVNLALLVGSVFVVVYSGTQSMAAFEGLPRYQVNSLAIAYRDAVKTFDQSMAATRQKLDGAAAQRVLYKSRLLSDQALVAERAFNQLLVEYAGIMAQGAEQIGGALEWNRYFQADVRALRDNSAARLQALQALFDRFPAPSPPEQPQDKSGATITGKAASPATGKN